MSTAPKCICFPHAYLQDKSLMSSISGTHQKDRMDFIINMLLPAGKSLEAYPYLSLKKSQDGGNYALGQNCKFRWVQ